MKFHSRLWKQSPRMSPVLALLLTLTFIVAASGSASAQTTAFTPAFAKFTTIHHQQQQVSRFAKTTQTVDTVPFWSSVFNANGATYPYQMVGTDPTNGSATTTVRTTLIALNLTFSDGFVLKGSQKTQDTLNSPLFKKADFTSGHTQYGDAIQRAEFWQYVQKYSKHYHVLLAQPNVTTVNLVVPAANGSHVQTKSGFNLGLIDINWFDSVLMGIMSAKGISPKTLPIFLSYDTFLYQGDPTQCCILGYHSAIPYVKANGTSAIQTYAYAAYSEDGIFGPKFSSADILSLSHEISEWYNDPFVDNVVPNWISPFAPQYGCNNFLEVGDPVAGVPIHVGNYHPEDEVFYSWFARQTPSVGINKQYTYANTFSTLSEACQP